MVDATAALKEAKEWPGYVTSVEYDGDGGLDPMPLC